MGENTMFLVIWVIRSYEITHAEHIETELRIEPWELLGFNGSQGNATNTYNWKGGMILGQYHSQERNHS